MQPRPRKIFNVSYISPKMRPRRRARGSPAQIAALRVCDLTRLFDSRYGADCLLPDDDAGRDDLELIAHHLAGLAHPKGKIRHWIEQRAPWLPAGEQAELIKQATLEQQHWTADQLAWRVRLTIEERTTLGITTIGAIDRGKAARTRRRTERERQRKANGRRAAGMKPRAEYEANALERTKPWLEHGLSRASWYRQKRHNETETGPVTA